MHRHPVRTALFAGFVYGSVLYGGVLSVLHLVYNRLGSPRDSLVLWAGITLLYGLAGALACGVGGMAATALRNWRFRRGAPSWPSHDDLAVLRGGVLFGVLAYNLAFWELFWLYGLTYDQVPFGRPAGPWGMLGYMALLLVAIAVAVVVLSWPLARGVAALAARGRLKAVAVAAWVLGIALHTVLPFVIGAPPAAVSSVAEVVERTVPKTVVRDTGLKVVLVGLDGADWQVLRPLMEKGQLPAFSALARDGASGSLATLSDSNSAVIWASIYTGLRPERHRILDFYTIHLPGMGGQGVFPVHRSIFKEAASQLEKVGLASQIPIDRFALHALPLWEICDRLGISIGVVDGYFYTFPALQPTTAGGFFFSYGLDDVAERRAGALGKRPEFFAQPKELFREIRPLLDRGDFGWQSSVLLDRLGRGQQPRFVNLYTHQPDTFQHWFWKWFQPQFYFGVSPEGMAENGDKIPGLHRDFDAFLAKLRAAVGPETVVVVASDHGHTPTILHSGYYTQHRHGPPGILLAAGGPVRRGLTLEGADIYDLYPTILYLLGLPIPQDAVGKVLLDALDPAFVRAHPVRTIPTYQVLGPPPGLPGVKRGGELDRREIEKLRSLGYIQ
jgi:hypothetical protein